MINKSQILFLLLVLSALPLSLAVAGCGSDDSAEASLSKDQFRKKANLICNNASIEQFENAGRYFNEHPGADEADLVKPVAIPPLEKQLEELKALGLPSGYEEEIEAYFEEFERALEDLREDPQSALSSQDNPFNKANSLGKTYKLGDCGQNP